MSDIDQGDLREDWKEHGFTTLLKKRMQEEARSAETNVFGACSQSTDPKVRAAYERFKATRELLHMIETGKF